MIRIEGNGGTRISCLEDWERHGAPRGGASQWQRGRSAYELARSWCPPAGPCVPPAIAAVLSSHPDFRDVAVNRARPEFKITFDDRRGEPRNADLAVEATDAFGSLAITIEGKADEPFDRIVSEVINGALEQIASGKRTGAIRRG